MLNSAMTTSVQETAGTLLQLPRSMAADRSPALVPFEDNLDHLKALELEATVMLSVTFLRRNGDSSGEDDHNPSFPEICRGKNLVETQQVLTEIYTENRKREELTVIKGIHLVFISFCDEWKLDRFERITLMLLLMLDVAPDFAATYDDCDLGSGKKSMEVGTLLAIICDNLRDQLACRRYFSVESNLIRNDLIYIVGGADDSTNIIDENVRIQERLVRYILGDNNLYSTCFRYVKREKSTVSLDQVILPGGDKDELVECMERYIANRDNATHQAIDEFYGYGTALVYLFHGPSGTGKTMLAKALAAKFNKTIFSLTADDMREMPGSYQEIIATLFREAGLQNGIVFFDECDDVFEAGSRASRALLIELEKARCVVILATNRPVELDPALERRISMKTYFAIPEADVRRKIWQALIPPTVTLKNNINLDDFAERYRFTGGLIRNTIFLALTAAGIENGKPVLLSAEQLHFAASKQTATLADERKVCTIELPTERLDSMPLEQTQKNRLKNLATVWQRLKERRMGLSLVITASDTTSAILAAKGVAKECGLVVRSYDFQQMLSRNPDDRIADPVTQRKVFPMDYAFSPSAGDEAMTLFIDRENMIGNMLVKDKDKLADIYMVELLSRLRSFTGMFCIVGKGTGEYPLPPELTIHERLLTPDRSEQEIHWRSVLSTIGTGDEQELQRIVRNHPMHISEIDFVVRQASILATVRRMAEQPSISDVAEVLERYKDISDVPLLFGG